MNIYSISLIHYFTRKVSKNISKILKKVKHEFFCGKGCQRDAVRIGTQCDIILSDVLEIPLTLPTEFLSFLDYAGKICGILVSLQ